MDIKGRLLRDASKIYQAHKQYNDRLIKEKEEFDARQLEEKRKEIQLQEEEKKQEIEQAKEQLKPAEPQKTETRPAKQSKDEDLFEYKKLFADWKTKLDNQPKFFSTLDENGNISSYYQSERNIREARQEIGKIPEQERTAEEKAYYEQLDPEYIKRAERLWDAAKTYQEAEEGKKSFAFWLLLKSAIKEGLSNPQISGPGIAPPGMNADIQNPMQGLTAETIKKTNDKKWLDDAFASYVQKKNIVEVETDAGNLVLATEERDYINKILDYVNDVDNCLKLNTMLQNQIARDAQNQLEGKPVIQGVVDKMQNELDVILQQLDQKEAGAKEAGSYSFRSPIKMGEARSQLKHLFDVVKAIKNGAELDQNAIKTYDILVNRVRDLYNKELLDLQENEGEWKERAEGNLKELRKWQAWHTPSKEYLEKEIASQENKFTDIDTYLYSMPGVMGSSASFNGTQMIGTALNWGGQAVSMAQHPVARGVGGAMIVGGAVANTIAGNFENSAEVGSNYKEGLEERLRKEGLYEKFIKDGKKQLTEAGEKFDTDDDVMTAFLLRKWMPDSKKIRDIAAQTVYGAHNLYWNDMMATTADVALDTSLSLFAPYGPLGTHTKFTPIPKAEALSRLYRMQGQVGKARIIEGLTAETAASEAASAMSPVAGGLFRATRTALSPITEPLSKYTKPFVDQLSKKFANVIGFSKLAPGNLVKASHGFNVGLDFAGRTLTRGFSEAVEEGKQSTYGKLYATGQLAGESRSVLDILLDDLSTGVDVGFTFLGDQLLGMYADKDLMSEMRGGFLGGLLNMNTAFMTARTATGVTKDMKAIDLVYNNLLAEKYKDRAAILDAENFARYYTSSDYSRMNRAFDKFGEVMRDVRENQEVGFTDKDILKLRLEYQKVFKLANSGHIKAKAMERGIEPHSKKYNTYVALINYIKNKHEEVGSEYNDDLDKLTSVLAEHNISNQQYQNLSEIVSNGLQDESLTDAQKKYLQDLLQELQSANPQLSGESLINAMQQSIYLRQHVDTMLAEYTALRKLNNEMQLLKETSPEEYLKHKEKAQFYKDLLDLLLAKNPGIFDEYENGTLDLSDIRDNQVSDAELYDTLSALYRSMSVKKAQLLSLQYSWMNLMGEDSLMEDTLEEHSYATNQELNDVLERARSKYKHQRKALSKAEKASRSKKATDDIIKQYTDSVESDEDFVEDINRDFRLYQQNREQIDNLQQSLQQESEAQFNPFEENAGNVSIVVDGFLKNSVFSTNRKAYKKDLFTNATEDRSRAQQAISLYEEGVKVEENKNTSIGVNSVNGEVATIPIAPEFKYVAIRQDGTRVYITQALADLIQYLQNNMESSIPVKRPKVKKQYEKPETTLLDYEDQILEAAINKDKALFDQLIDKVKPYLSNEKVNILLQLWEDSSEPGVTTIVPTGKETPLVQEGVIMLKVRKAANAVYSVVTILHNYTNAIPTDEQLAENQEKFLTTIPEQDQKAVKKELNKEKDGVSRQKLAEFYVNAGFDIRSRTTAKSVLYEAVAPTGESYRITKLQYLYASWLKHYKDVTGNTTLAPQILPVEGATEKQMSVLNALREKLANENPQVIRNDLRTGQDYFIVENGHLVRYSRVHSKLQPTYENGQSWQRDRQSIITTLKSLFGDKEAYKKEVLRLQDRYNAILELKYGKDSNIYKERKLDLQAYLTDDIIIDELAIYSIANMTALKSRNGKYEVDIPTRGVIAGLILDDICRAFFSGQRVLNNPEWMIPQDVFNRLLDQLKEQKKIYDDRGWILSTEPYCWHCVMSDGTKVAGETDMIAVDRDGGVHIIDFKTSKYSFQQEQYSTNSILGQAWADVTQDLIDSNSIPEEAERRIFNVALDEKTKTQSRTSREYYSDQQTFYANMIRANLNGIAEVKTISILAFNVRTKAAINPVNGLHDEALFGGFARSNEELNSRDDGKSRISADGIEFQGAIELSFSEDINKLGFTREDLSPQRKSLSVVTSKYNDVYNRVVSMFTQHPQKISVKSKLTFDTIQTLIQVLAQKSVDPNVLQDKLSIERLILDIEMQLAATEGLEEEIKEEIRKYDEEHPVQVQDPNNRKLNPNRKQSLGETVKFNCLDIFDERYVSKDLARVSANPDFMESAVFEIDVYAYEKSRVIQGRRIATPAVFVTISYDEHLPNGTVKHHKFDRIKLLFAKQDPSGNKYTPGLDGSNTSPMLAKIESILQDPENKGKRIILTNGSRTNGIVKYGSTTKPVQQVFNLNDEDIEQCLTGTKQGSTLGINKRGSVYRTSANRGNLVPLHGIDPDRALTDGLMSWHLNLGYDEDKGSGEHSIPVTLTPKPLKKSDVAFIIDLLKNFTKKRKIKINGKEYDCPISNSRLLHSIIRFGRGAEETQSRFRFDWANVDDKNFSTDEYRTVRITKYSQNDPTKVEYEYIVDLNNDQHVQWLSNTLLSEYYVYANNEYAMWHATTASRDASSSNPNASLSNPFVGLEQFFKQNKELTEGNEDVVIEFSESFKFRRSDVDPNLDGSYSGINGIHWMMKNGWLETNFAGVSLPLISFNDVKVENANTIEPEDNTFKNPEEHDDVVLPSGVGTAEEWADAGDNFIDGQGIEFKLQTKPAQNPLDRLSAEKHLRKILGNSFSIEFQDKAIDMFMSGWTAVAGCKTDSIILTDLAENGVEFHEAFHAVVDLLVGEKRRQLLYKHYREKYGSGQNLTDTDVSEGLADMYYAFRMNTPIEWSWNIMKVFKQIANWVKQMYALHDSKLAWLFFLTNMGYFRNRKPDPESVKAFNARNKRTGMQYYALKDKDGKDVEFKTFTSFRQIDDAIEGILYRIIRDFGIDNLATNIDNIRTDKKSLTDKDSRFAETYKRLTMHHKTEDEINEAVEKGFISQAAKTKLLLYRELFDNWAVTQKYIEAKLKAMGVDAIKQRLEKNAEDGNGGNVVKDMIDLGNGEFYNHARSEAISVQVRYFLSSVPSVRWLTQEDIDNGLLNPEGKPYTSIYMKDKKGNIVYDKFGKPVRVTVALSRNTMGEVTFLKFLQVYQKLLKNLYDVKDVSDLLKRLDDLSENDYIFYHIKKSLYQFRYKSYVRYDVQKNPEYKDIPVVLLNGQRLNPIEYISNTSNPTEDEKYPVQVRYSHDIVDEDTGEIIHKRGDIIEGAVILTNPNYEAITTLIFQAIKSQKLNFMFCYENAIIGEDGEIVAGKHKYSVASTGYQSDVKAYPILWFNGLRSATFGILDEVDGEVHINRKSENAHVFEDARIFLRKLLSRLAPNMRHKMQLDGTIKRYDIDNSEDFDKILAMFVSHLNSIGIMITKPAIIYSLTHDNPNISMRAAFENMFTTNEETSISTFIQDGGVLDKLQKAVDEGNVQMFTQDVDVKANAKTGAKASRTGSYLYSTNGFVSSMASALSKYRNASQEMMVLGPDNTRMYTFAQNHSASDTTYELNHALDEDGNVVEGNIMHDLQNVDYVSILQDGRRLGSIIAKRVLDPNFNRSGNRLVLCTSSGIKAHDQKGGGTKYAEITEREDYLSKTTILRNGGLVFPTLSDKSTWFYLSGIQLPGFNWSAKNMDEFGTLPVVGLKSGKLFFSKNDSMGSFYQHTVLDQMIEYALCELANIEKTIRDLGLDKDQDEASLEALTDEKKVKNYHTQGKPDDEGNYKDAGIHGARFFFLTGVYDERTGKFIEFNKVIKSDKDLGVVRCYLLAKQYFFDKVTNPQTGQLETDEELRARQRAQISAILQKRLDEELLYLIDTGIIEYDENQTKYHIQNVNGITTRVKDQLPWYFGLKNKYLDDSDIEFLAQAYKIKFGGKYSMDQCRSLAIMAYIFDINNKSIMSMEETERIYTGMPQFFKCQYDKEGHLVDRGEDESKRYGGEGSTGVNNREDIPNIPTEYTCAEIKDWEVKSSIHQTLSTSFELDEYRDALANKRVDELKDSEEYTLEKEKLIYDEVYAMDLEQVKQQFSVEEQSIINAKINGEARSFESGINVADGTAYISDRMAENLLRQRGAYNDQVKEAFEYLRNHKKATFTVKSKDNPEEKHEIKIKEKNGYLTSTKAYRIIHNALISTLKYTAFGYRMENGVPVHFYNKYALFPIFEGISYGFTHTLYEKMNDPNNPVDMVMFDSAVKSGSEGALKFNPDMTDDEIKNFSFAGHIYKQKYKFIRRQLNTDPREDEIMSMGTQAVKIALSTLKDGQTYTLRDGSTILGAELKSRIMNIQKELSDRGVTKVREKFFENGQLSIRKLSEFLKEELMSRNADKNILDALEVVTNNGLEDFKVDLNTVSNMAWAESILCSFINKQVIDINLPGNAFYQRSVFGMDSPVVLSEEDLNKNATDYLINGGKPLQMINEKGSMDAVISIDYFMHLIPKEIRHNFKKARQFLIDNKIIGPEADANTIGYRIPTQAVSSVHALRFVDVLPVVRDTIVLPKEFTKITGSDFDIDKLYLSSINYKLNEDNTVTSKFEEGSTQQMLNDMLMCYFSLLEDAGKQVNNGEISMSRYMHMLHRSIDNDTSLATSVLDKIEAGMKKDTYEPFRFGCLHTQVRIKNAFVTGKSGIGPFALNAMAHILTMLYNVSFEKSEHGILDVINRRSLGRSLDRDGNSIMSWLSAMINLHVDAAKDPKIIRMNINKATYNLTNLLLRIGLGLDALYFLSQPIVKDLAQVYMNENGDIVEDPGLSPTQRYNRAEAQYIASLRFKDVNIQSMIRALVNRNLPDDQKGNVTKEDVEKYRIAAEPIIKAIFSVGEDGKYERQFETTNGIVKGKSILEDLLTNPECRIDPNKPATFDNLKDESRYKVGNNFLSPKEIQAYVFVAKQLFDTYAEAMSDVVTHTKIDTKKQGKNYQEQRNYKKNYKRIHDAFKIARETNTIPNSMFDENLETMLDESFIDTKTNNGTLTLLEDILGTQLIHMTPLFQEIVDDICEIINNRTVSTKMAVQRALLTYIKQKCMNRVMLQSGVDFKSLISGTNTLSNRIDALKQKMLADRTGKYSDFVVNGIITNSLLDNIHAVPYTPAYGQQYYSILTLDNIQSDDEQRENDYIDSWNQMLESEDEEIRGIAEDLAIYAFMTSGDNVGFTKFFKYVPDSWRVSSGYDGFVREMKEAFVTGSITLDGMPEMFLNIDSDELIRNNWSNPDIVPTMSGYTKRNKTRAEIEETGNNKPVYVPNYTGRKIMYKDLNAGGMEVDKSVDLVVAGVIVTNGKLKITISMNANTASFPPYIKMRRRNASINSADPYVLYKLVTTATRRSSGGKIYEYPIYALTYPKGYSIKASGQRYDFYEYERDDSYTHIFDPSVMIGEEYGDRLAELSQLLDDYVRSYGNLPMYLDPVIGEEEVVEVDEDGNKHYNKSFSEVLIDVYLSNLYESQERNFDTGRQYPDMPEFNKLPAHTGTTMTYAGIGSRRLEGATDPDSGRPLSEVMKEVATELEERGYTLNSGHADGSDQAFESGVNDSKNKNIFVQKDATSRMYKIAKEVHPNYGALGAYAKGLHARNTALVFGRYLDTPVDFVLCYTPDGAESDARTGATEKLTGYNRPGVPNTGGTGQAISMASMKGIPVINMANPGWRARLDAILAQSKLYEPESYEYAEDSGISGVLGTNEFLYSRYANNMSNYEVSSRGDSRFSAMNATFVPGTILFGHDVGGRTIESVYQHGVKQGDWVTDNNNKTGAPRDKTIITGNTENDSYTQGYLPLWQEWAKQNPQLIEELRQRAQGKILTDMFASTAVSQARALADILNNAQNQKQETKTEMFGVIIDPNLIHNYRSWLLSNPNGIVAYRVNRQSFNTAQSVQDGIIGNPFDWDKYGTGNAVKMFYTWLIKGTTFGESLANELFRQAIILKILNSEPGTPILYYKELGRPSHATVLGYLIQHKEELLLNDSNIFLNKTEYGEEEKNHCTL